MSRVTRLLVVVLCGVVVTNAMLAHGQEETKPIGASITVGAKVSDNVDSAADGDERDNVDIFVSPRVDLMHQTDALFLDLFYAPMYRWRSDPSDVQNDDEWQHDLSLIGSARLSERTTLRAMERFNYTDDPEVTEGGVELRRDASYILNRAAVGLTHDVTDTLNADAVVQHRIKLYDEDMIADRFDEESVSAELTARQKVTDTLVGMAMIGAEMVEFEEANGIERGFDAVYGGVGMSHEMSDTVSVNALVGIQAAEYDDASIDSEVSPMVRLGLDAALAQDVDFRVRGTYKLDNAFSFPYTSQRHTDIYAHLTWRATQDLGLSVFGEYRLEDYDADTVNPVLTAVSGDETTLLAQIAATYKVLSKTSVTAAYLVEDVDSDVDTTFTRNAGLVSVTQEF